MEGLRWSRDQSWWSSGRRGGIIAPSGSLLTSEIAADDRRYYLNGKNATYKEVQDLLKGKGIDLDHNRFLILQVRLDSFSLLALTVFRAKSNK